MIKRDIQTGGIVPNQFHSTSLHQHCSGSAEPILKTPQCLLLYYTGICFYCIRIVCETYKQFKNYILICVHCNLWVVMTKFLSGHLELWEMKFVCFVCLSRMPSPFSYLSVLTSCFLIPLYVAVKSRYLKFLDKMHNLLVKTWTAWHFLSKHY